MKNVRNLLTALICLFAVQASFAQVTITPWQINMGKGHIKLNNQLATHGDAAAYAYAEIPAQNDAKWTPATVDVNEEVIFNQRSTVPCLTAVDFTYFQTIVNIPANTDITKFEVNFLKADDGARFYVFNDKHPNGVFPPGKDLVLGQMNEDNKIDLREYIKVGGENRLVVVQFDDCASGNYVNGIHVSVDGQEIKPPSGPCSDEYVKIYAKAFGRIEKNTFVYGGESILSSNGRYRLVVPNEKEKPRIEELSDLEICEETGDTVARVVNTVWRMPYYKRTGWQKYDYATFVFQKDCNLGYANASNFYWNATTGRDEFKGLLNKCSHAELTDDGRLVIIGTDGSETWSNKPAEIKPDITRTDGGWTFGYGGPLDDITPFEETETYGPVKYLKHNDPSQKWWSVAQNTTEENYYRKDHGVMYPPKSEGKMVFHPGNAFKSHAKAKFTAPTDGTYKISAIFTLVDKDGGKVKCSMFTNAASKGATAATPVVKLLEAKTLQRDLTKTDDRPSVNGSKTVVLKAGEWVTIDVQNAGDWVNDSTEVEFSASKVK
ncbi:MAG: hypothetical protein AAF551_08225 [Bacteroidota bacterium]